MPVRCREDCDSNGEEGRKRQERGREEEGKRKGRGRREEGKR
jgi:hypothetical protein